MTDSDLSTITERCHPRGHVYLIPIGTLYGTGTPRLILQVPGTFRLYAVATLAEFDLLAKRLIPA